MARLSLRSVKAEITALGVEKVGYTAYYVDDTLGSNEYDGLTWETPFLTIQHAIDESESWAKIYVKAGTYSEGVIIPIAKRGLNLIGEDETTTIISNTNGTGIRIRGAYSSVKNVTALSSHPVASRGMVVESTASYSNIDSCVVGKIVGGAYGSGILVLSSTKSVVLNNIYIDQSNLTDVGIVIYQSDFVTVKNCYLKGAGFGIQLQIPVPPAYGDTCKIFDNTITSCTRGIYLDGHKNTFVYHNNFINNPSYHMQVEPSPNFIFENYYDDHTTDTNNDGLCDTQYSIGGAAGLKDYSPVSKPYGWKQLSLGTSTSTAIDISTILSIVNGTLTLRETGGTITTNGAVQTLYINNAPAGVFPPRKLLIDFTNHVAGDVMVVRTYYRLNAAGGLIKQDEETIPGVQDPAIITIDLEDNRFGYQITIEKTVGANLTYDWEVIYKI